MPTFTTFRYLFIPKESTNTLVDPLRCKESTPQCNLDEVLEMRYPTIESLGKRFVVRNSLENKYYVFDDMSSFSDYFDKLDDSNKCFHEVIIGKRPQRIKFDIDAVESLLTSCVKSACENDPEFNVIGEAHNSVLQDIDEAICNSFYVAYQKIITPDDILTTTSTAYDPECKEIKYSYHKVIKGYYVESNTEAANYVSEYFTKFLRPDFHPIIDFYVYKSIQNFRIVHNHKENSDRVKVPVGEYLGLTYYIVQNIEGCVLLPKKMVVDSLQRKGSTSVLVDSVSNFDQTHLTNNDINKALALANIGDDHTVRKINGGLIEFKRLQPSYCDLCKRKHDNDNTLILSVVTDNSENNSLVSRVYMLCRHNRTGRVYMGSFEPELVDEVIMADNSSPLYENNTTPKLTKKIVQEKVLDLVLDQRSAATNQHSAATDQRSADQRSADQRSADHSKFLSLPADCKNIYSSKELKDFEYVDTLCIRAGMKMGKTKKLVEYVNKYFNDTDYYTNNIILVSFRQTFSKEVQNKFKGFVLYNEVSGELNDSRVIIQVESLHRITIGAGKHRPDLLILDECESIFDQFDSGLHKKFAESWAVFKWLMAYSSHLVCMDANLSNRTYEIISRMRSKFLPTINYHFNSYQNATDDTYNITVNKSEWYLDLYNSLGSGNKIAVAISSLTEAKVLYEGIMSKYPTLKIGFYSSKTPMSEKKLHFSNVDEYWSCYDVLIYTPTVSAGISFEKPHYDKLYAYFTDSSCHAEVCIQMIGRIRNLKSKNYVVCIDSTRRNLPVDVGVIRNTLMDSRSNLFKEMGESPLEFEYDASGKVKFYENDYFYVWLENTRIKNLSKNNFIQRFVHLISSVGPKIVKLSVKADLDQLNDIEVENIGLKNQIKNTEADLIVKAPELTVTEITAVMNKFIDSGVKDLDSSSASLDLTNDERYGFEKFRLRRDYQWGGKIDKQFVQEYNNPRSRRIFRNLVKITGFTNNNKEGDMLSKLADIQNEERINYEVALDSEEKYLQDVRKKYMFDQHWLAVEMLRICGITSLRDTTWISQHDLKKAFIANEKKMYNALMNLSKNSEDQVKKPVLYAFTYKETKNAREYVGGILTHINKILLSMYGIKIASSRADPDIYKLQPNKQFDLISDDAKSIPCVNAKWRPLDDSGEVSGPKAPYMYLD